MKRVSDTNVLIYAANARAREHARRHALLEEWSAAGARQFLSTLFQSPGLGVLVATDRHAQVLAQVIGEVPLLAGKAVGYPPTRCSPFFNAPGVESGAAVSCKPFIARLTANATRRR